MLSRLWYSVSHVGVNSFESWPHNRYIILTNRVSILISLFTVGAFLIGLRYFGFILPVALAIISSTIYLIPIALNSVGWNTLSRLFLCISLSIVGLTISVLDKTDVPIGIEPLQYFEFRYILLGASIFPFVLFQLRERASLITCVSINLLCLMGYDPVHEFFGVGYYDLGLTSPNYYFINFMSLFALLLLISCTYFLKFSFETYEEKNQVLIKNLHTTNDALSDKTRALARHQNELIEANEVIEKQRQLLARENVLLNRELVEKNNRLTETNAELIQHNNDLLQFSYTVSHNLRGPVASLIGLISLIDTRDLDGENLATVEFLKKSVSSLDSTIKDLSAIIDIRNKISTVKHRVILQDELAHIINLLKKDVDDHGVRICSDFSECLELYSVKAMISSILYNLVSNAIKYRSWEREPVITLRSYREEDYVRLEVEDNGLGLDVPRFKEKIFGLYKRFHTHTEGKGLGLFLVKLQAEALGGRVDVQSELDHGTTFTIWVRDHQQQTNPESAVLQASQ